jgi:small subunit ribosomal protein S5
MANTNNSKGGRRPFREKKEFQEELLSIDRVTRVTAGGRQLRFRASIVIGDGKGRVGFGTGKSGEVVSAIQKAINNAKKNLVKVEICPGNTVSHDIKVKFKSAVIMLHPASEGT